MKCLGVEEGGEDRMMGIEGGEDLGGLKESGKSLVVKGVVKEGGKGVGDGEMRMEGRGKGSLCNGEGELRIEGD